MELQKLAYFTEGNTFTGSQTKDPEKEVLLRYRAEPDPSEGGLKVWAWTKDLCFERAGEREEKTFPLNQQGLEEAEAWLQSLYDAL